MSAGRTQTREGARYRRLARRIGKDKAQVAVAATQLRVCHALLTSPGTRYQDLGADFYDKRAQTRRKARYHPAEPGAPGCDIILTPRPGPDTNQATRPANRSRLTAPRPQATHDGPTVAASCYRLPS